MEYLEVQRVKLMGHPTYSPDLSPCDFWLLPKIKDSFVEKIFRILVNSMMLSKNTWIVSEKRVSINAMNSGSKE
jgi:hypothetical protein